MLQKAMARAFVVGLSITAVAGCRQADSSASAAAAAASSSGGTGGSTGVFGTQPRPQHFSTIVRGADSHATLPADVLVTDQGGWSALWAIHSGGVSAPPAVAFPADAVIGTFQGAIRRPGASSEIVRVDRDAVTGNVRSLVREFVPGAWRAAGAAVSPFHLVSTAAPAAGAQLFVAREALLDFEAIDAGSQSLYTSAQPGELIVFRTSADLAAFWPLHSTDPVPAVDFSTDMVVAVFVGASNFGTSVSMQRILHNSVASELRVEYEVGYYRGGARPPQVTEFPYQILRVTHAAGAIRRELKSSLPPQERARGTGASYAGALDVQVVRDAASFQALCAARLPAGTAPVVDFSTEQAILVFAGSASLDVWVNAVDILEDGEIEIAVDTEMPFGSGAPGGAFQVVAIPRTFGPWSSSVTDVTPRP